MKYSLKIATTKALPEDSRTFQNLVDPELGTPEYYNTGSASEI
jgi:hypothetical protein